MARTPGPGTLEGIQTIDEDGLTDFTVTAAPTFGRTLDVRVVEIATSYKHRKALDGTRLKVIDETAYSVSVRGAKVYGTDDEARAMARAVRIAAKHLRNYAEPRGIDRKAWALVKDLAKELGTTSARINREARRAAAERSAFGSSHFPAPVQSSNLRDYYPREPTLHYLKAVLDAQATRAA